MNVLFGIYIIGLISYLIYAGYLAEKYKTTTKTYVIIFCTLLWPLFVLMAVGTVLAKRRA